MKYLQTINEKVSLVYEENLEFLLKNSGYDELNSLLQELAKDLCDEFNSAEFSIESYVDLKYKRSKRVESSTINIKFFKEPSGTLTNTDKKYVADFLSKAEHARSMRLIFTLRINIGDIDKDKIVSELQNIADHVKSYGYNVRHASDKYGYVVNDLNKYVKDQCDSLVRWSKTGNPYLCPYYIIVEENLDVDLFKPGHDYLNNLPDKIISDFKAFCDRFKMNSGDREQLSELIKKAKEE